MPFFSDKVALITGGAGAIGLSMAKILLAQEIKGLALVDLNQEAGENAVKEITANFGPDKAIFIKTDITVPEEFERAFEKTVEKFQQIDIVVNNAGVIDEQQWEKTIAVNFVSSTRGTFLAMKKYLLAYKTGSEGIIVNVASRLGLEAIPFLPVYCATKHAVIGLGQALALEDFYKTYKCRILTLCPGPVDTPLLTSDTGNRVYFPEKIDDEIQMYRDTNFMQTPENVAGALIDVIKTGRNGSIWVVDSNKPAYEIKVPEVDVMKVNKT